VAVKHSAGHQVRDTLSEIWAEVLRAEPGDDDDFFDLGGDSLAMVKALFLVEERLGIELSVDELFADSFTFGSSVEAVAAAVLEAHGPDEPS
jgi:acyl carrier protein